MGDIATGDKMKDNVMNFYGIIGSIILVFGFCLQFSGTILIIGLDWWWMLLFITIAFALSFAVLYFLTGQTVGQSRGEKAKILLQNLKRILIIPIRELWLSKDKIICELCLKPVGVGDAQIWYKQGTNSDKHPYLYRPYGFYMGHVACLAQMYPDKKPTGLIGMSDPVHKFDLKPFYDTEILKQIIWLKECRSHWLKQRNGYIESATESEVSIQHLENKLSKKFNSSKKRQVMLL